jgi:hypothetical protein
MTNDSNRERSTRIAQRLVQRLEGDTEYLAHVFSAIRSAEGMDDRDLATTLGTTPEMVPRIALCRTPRHDLFREDINEIADHFALEPDRLAQVVRHGETLSAFANAYAADFLAAARDHAAEERGDYAPEDNNADVRSGDDENPQNPERDAEKPGGER